MKTVNNINIKAHVSQTSLGKVGVELYLPVTTGYGLRVPRVLVSLSQGTNLATFSKIPSNVRQVSR